MAEFLLLIRRPAFYLKIVELMIALLCTLLVAGDVHVGWAVTSKIQVVYATLNGYIMINLVAILSPIMNSPLHIFILLLISSSGAVMFLAAASLMCEFYTWANPDVFLYGGRLLTSGLFAFINCAVYTVDTVLTYKQRDAASDG